MRAVEEAIAKDKTILVVTQRVPRQRISCPRIYEIGTEATVGRMLRMPDGTISVLVRGSGGCGWLSCAGRTLPPGQGTASNGDAGFQRPD